MPEASAVHNQRTCGAAPCRRRRRNHMARRHREREIHAYRVFERERQARCRAKRRKKRQKRGRDAGVSRAGLPAQVTNLEEVVLEEWDRLVGVSRAGLRREIRMALGKAAQIVGQDSVSP